MKKRKIMELPGATRVECDLGPAFLFTTRDYCVCAIYAEKNEYVIKVSHRFKGLKKWLYAFIARGLSYTETYETEDAMIQGVKKYL